MASTFPNQYYDSYDGDDDDDYIEPENQDELDNYINSRGGIDKCMNCGKYQYNDSLTYPGQVCINPCRNPNEY